MEIGQTDRLYENPTHPYTQGLMSAVPRLDDSSERLITIPGNPPNMMLKPIGCPFSPRCQYTQESCSSQMPELLMVDKNVHYRACHVAVKELT
jgi:oligopeptide transport system ATP-binding protein